MMMKRILGGVAVAILLAAAGAAHAEDTAYQIKCQRPVKVDEKFTIDSTVEQTDSVRLEINGAERKKNSAEAKYIVAGTFTVTAVDEKGRETGLHLTVKTVQVSREGTDPVAVLEPGAEVDITYKDKKAEFTLKGGQLSDDAKAALGSVFSPPMSDKTDDDMFGTPDKKKAGESWPVNSKAMAEDATGSSIEIDPAKITGKTTLTSIGKLSDIPAMTLKTDVDITDLTLPNLGKAKVAHMQVSVEAQFPIDTANPSGHASVAIVRHAIFEKDQAEGKSTLSLDSKIKRVETRLLVK